MPQNIVDVPVFTDPIVAPVDGDPAVGASVNNAIQGLSNRTRQTRYKDGAWTPVLSATGTNNVTMSIQNGTYVRIGNVVTVCFRIFGSIGASTGGLLITGFPYLPDLSASQRFSVGTALCLGASNFIDASYHAPVAFEFSTSIASGLAAAVFAPDTSGSANGNIGGAFVASQLYELASAFSFITADPF